MGVLKNGMYGELKGRVGNTVHYNLRGRNVVRMVGKNTKPPTVRQLGKRQGMVVVSHFIRQVSWFSNIGFSIEAAKRDLYPQNAAVGYNLKHALKGTYPDVELDYSNVLLSKGELAGLRDATVLLEANAETGQALRFNWLSGADDGEWPRCADRVMLLAYAPAIVLLDDQGAERRWEPPAVQFHLNTAERQAGTAILKLPEAFVGRTIEVYLSVVGQCDRMIADSQYMGRILH